jgi:DNA-binding GntR family transcriptional regulator
MPSEERLAEELRVSRASLRTAMAGLAAEGFVQRRHGDGTYPSPRAFDLGFRTGKVWDIVRQIQESGRKPSIQTLEQGFRLPNPDEKKLLLLDESEQVLAFRRLFTADDKPVALITNAIRSTGLSQDVPEEVASLPPLDFLGRYSNRKPGASKVYFNAILAGEEAAALLQVAQGSPLLKMSGVLSDPAGVPIMVETELYPGEEGFQMQAGLIQS